MISRGDSAASRNRYHFHLPQVHLGTATKDRTASRPRLAARWNSRGTDTRIATCYSRAAAASRGRLAVRWQPTDAPTGHGRGTFPLLQP
jgi:hypothetical protein